MCALFFVRASRASDVWINEILFNPPGVDAPNEYIELRGAPNLLLTNAYLLAVEGDTNGNPGTIQNVFDLSGRRLGGNGLLVLLQNTNGYTPHPNATIIVNTNGPGFGSGSTSTAGHRGRNGQTDLGNASVTFFLVDSATPPAPGVDIDADNDGLPDGEVYVGWVVDDAVGILDNDGAGDIAYGLINFRRNTAPGNGATALTGTVVGVGFTPSYIGRSANTTTWTASAWVAADVSGTAPTYSLSVDTVPAAYGGRALNHVGSVNFGAAALPGVVLRESDGSTDVGEGSGTDSYTLALNTNPIGNINVQIVAGAGAEVSIDGGSSFAAARIVVLNSTAPRTVVVRALDDSFVEATPHIRKISHAVTATQDPARYPTTTLIPPVEVRVAENDLLLLSEIKVNPPAPDDAPYEFIELRGTPNAVITNVSFVALEGNAELNPGLASMVLDLTGRRLGSSGLLLIVADGHPYSVPAGTRVILAPQLALPGGALGNDTVTFALIGTSQAITEGADLDAGDNGILEGLPADGVVIDSVGWSDGGGNDVVFTTALLTQPRGTPDAATRFIGDNTANSASAWFNGDIAGTSGEALAYEQENVSAVFPAGTWLSPGGANDTAPTITRLTPYSNVIGDPTSPPIAFTINDAETPASLLMVSAASSDTAVVPDSNLTLTGGGSQWILQIDPVGVGYATITISVSDGVTTLLSSFPYAASADPRGTGRFHTGVSDASTGIAIDANYALIGDDENQVLRIFSRSNSGPAIAELSMDPFLGLTDFYDDGRPKEVDIEGSTRVGDRIYWIGSHSHARDTDVRTNRARIFATDLSAAGTNSLLSFVGRYDFLKADLIAWDTNNQHGRGANYFGLAASGAEGIDPKDPSGIGFNIEGLAMAPDNSTAFICFRAPLVPPTNRVHALIVPVTNFANLAISGATPGAAQLGAPIELNLGGRGIRSIEGNANGYVMVAGPPGIASGTAPSDYRFFTWRGLATDAPQEHSTVLNDVIPEGIVELPPFPWTAQSTFQLISDSGITVYYGDGIEAKHLPIRQFKKFRTDWFALGDVVVSQPVIRWIARSGTDCIVDWLSVAGHTYRVQGKATLSDAAWSDLAGDIVATGATASKAIPNDGAQRFFRVVLLP